MASLAMYEAQAKVYKALAHPSRLMMVEELCKGERCVQELVEMVGSNFSTVSKHLAQLKEAGVIKDERRGQQIFYSVRLQCVAKSLECSKSIVSKNFAAQMDALKSDFTQCPEASAAGKTN